MDRPGGPEPRYAEHPGYGIWPCDNPWHTARRLPYPDNDLSPKCPDCPNGWWAWDGTGCPDDYALLAEIRWLRARLDLLRKFHEADQIEEDGGRVSTSVRIVRRATSMTPRMHHLLSSALSGAACGVFFWIAATKSDWLAGVAAGMFLAGFILNLRALSSDR